MTAPLPHIKARLREFYSASEIDAWLTLKHPQLDDESPLTAIVNGRESEVLAILDRLESGAYL